MLKRSFLVLALLGTGIALGVLATGVLKWRDGVSRAYAAVPKASPTPSPAPTPSADVAAPAPASTPAPPPQAGGLRIGIVNLKQCFDENNYAFFKDQRAEFKKNAQETAQKIKDIEKRMKDLEQQLEGIKDRDSALYREKIKEYKLAEVSLKMEREVGRTELLNKNSELLAELYNEIRRAIDVWAKDKYDLILFADEPLLEDDSPDSVAERIRRRTVLYSAPGLDITKQVLEVLNSEYAKRKPKSTDGTPGECPTCKIKTTDTKCPKCGGPVPKSR